MPAIDSCRSCHATDLQSVLDLGTTPLANALLTEEQTKNTEEIYPLHLVWCPHCTLLQITENVPAEKLFAQYFYRSSFSDAFLRHCKTLADRMIAERTLGAQSLVVDIASNDGYLLQFYQEKGIPILGVEPARNIVEIAVQKGIPTRHTFFTYAEAAAMAKEGKTADVIHAHNVMPHVANQRDFAAGIATLLKREGVAIIEFAYAIDTISHTEFDQIYHEHMCYFSLTSFKALCAQFGLAVQRVERLPVHGGSLRVFLMHASGARPDETVRQLLEEERAWGVTTIHPYAAFAARTSTLKTALMGTLHDLKAQGNRIAVYGASAKGSTLMNYFGITKNLVEYIVDRSTLKQGRYAPGTHLKIEPVEILLQDMPEYVLLLTWNFAEEIMEQQKAYRAQGGKFIVPVPEVKII
jgi:SAM-dependent methyltransferase